MRSTSPASHSETPASLSFTTLAPGLDLALLVPSDGTDGIAQTSPIAVFFDRPIDPDSLSDEVLTLTPDRRRFDRPGR